MEEKVNQAIVQTHITTLQGIICRMSNYSLNCKTWAITIITGIIVLLFDKTKTSYYYIIYFPLLIFYLLDSYYLGLERVFRDIYNAFILEVQNSTKDEIDIRFSLKGKKIKSFLKSLYSVSTLPFYIVIGIAIFVIKIVVK